MGSGMAVHSFASIGEIRNAPDEKTRDAVREQVLAESKSFDDSIRQAFSISSAKERQAALLELEKLYEFKRSHPTVEVQFIESFTSASE